MSRNNGLATVLGLVASITNQRGTLYQAGRKAGDITAVERSVETGSPRPILKRLAHKAIGRAIGRSGIYR